MHNISRKKISITKYSNVLKEHKNLKEHRKTQQIPWNEKRGAKNAKISKEIIEKNIQHDIKKIEMCVW
jgi:hypothetical protein